MTQTEFEAAHPGLFQLDPDAGVALTAYLRERGILAADEEPREIRRAGAGNMNRVVRVRTDRASWIVKQSRPWVEKYPQFAAPWDRALRELEFYRGVAGLPGVADRMPALRWADPEARLLVLEDLGEATDYTGLYAGEMLSPDTTEEVADYLSALHSAFPEARAPFQLANREMRALNAEHIFFLPLREDNGLDLDRLQPGLRRVARPWKADSVLRAEVERLGRAVYLVDGPRLVHGDFFPGSVLRSDRGPRMIDPEFGFFGRPEFDVGVWLAHLAMARQPPGTVDRFLARYRRPAGYDDVLARKLAGVEIIRRLLGYAQLPLALDVQAKGALLERAAGWVRTRPA